MPLINVIPAITSPMLVDSFSVNRRQQFVDNFGYASTTSVVTPNVGGVVYPSNENELRRIPDLQVNDKAVTVITRFALRSESETVDGTEYQPDIVIWQGDNFVVRKIEDWGSYAAGFFLAICTSIDLVDRPPDTEG